MSAPAWTPFAKATRVYDPAKRAELIRAMADSQPGLTAEAIGAAYDAEFADGTVVINSRYQVVIRDAMQSPEWPAMWWLSIKRLDKEPVHDWRDLQRIKNELVGPEHEAVELYPANSRLVDSANQYHLWVFKDDKVRLPFGFLERFVDDNAGQSTGVKQRSFSE